MTFVFASWSVAPGSETNARLAAVAAALDVPPAPEARGSVELLSPRHYPGRAQLALRSADPIAAVRAAVRIGEFAGWHADFSAAVVTAGPTHVDRQIVRARRLARQSTGAVILDYETRRQLGTRAVVEPDPVDSNVFRLVLLHEPDGVRAARRGARLSFDQLIQLLAATAGLAAWIVIVGGARMAVRFHAAHVSWSDGVAALPRGVLIAEGLAMLGIPLLIAVVAAGAVYVVRLDDVRSRRLGRLVRLWWRRAAIGWALVIVLAALIYYLVWDAIRIGWLVGIVLIVVVAGIVVYWIAVAPVRPALAAGLVFGALIFWGGCFQLAAEAGAKLPRLEEATINRTNGDVLHGLLVARGSDAVYVAQPPTTTTTITAASMESRVARPDTGVCSIIVVPSDDVRDVRIGVSPTTTTHCGDLAARGAPTPHGPVTTVTRTTTVGTVTTATTVTLASPHTTTITLTDTTHTTTLPAGADEIGNGDISIPVEDVSLPDRLVVSGVSFLPRPVTSPRTRLRVTIRVRDTRGYVVRGALVFVRGVRLSELRPLRGHQFRELRTGLRGFVRIDLRAGPRLQFIAAVRVPIFIRARKPGQALLAGVSTRRLVHFYLGSPR